MYEGADKVQNTHESVTSAIAMQNHKYELEKALEERDTADTMCNQLKRQLATVEEKLANESNVRRSINQENQKLEKDVLLQNELIEKLEYNCQELKSHYESTTILQNEEKEEKIRQIQIELQTVNLQLSQKTNELLRTQALFDESKLSSDNQISQTTERFQETSIKLDSTEKELFQVKLQYENEVLKTKSLLEKLEKSEKMYDEQTSHLKHKFEEMKNNYAQLENKFKVADFEHKSTALQSQNEKQFIEKSLSDTRLMLTSTVSELTDARNEIDSLKGELKSAHMVLTDTTNVAATSQKHLKETEDSFARLKEEFQEEKLKNTTLESKLETSHEKLEMVQAECNRLSQDVLSLKEEITNLEHTVQEKETSNNAYINTLNDTFLSEKEDILLNLNQSKITIEKLQCHLKEKDDALQEKSLENLDLIESFSRTKEELSKENSEKIHLHEKFQKLGKENSDLNENIRTLNMQIKDAEKEKNELGLQNGNLKLELQNSKSLCNEMAQRMQKKGNDLEIIRLENSESKKLIEETKRMKFVIEGDLQEERIRADNTRQDLADVKRARESLETLVTKVREENIGLEEQLKLERAGKMQYEQEISDQKGLLELEMRSRSKVGAQVIELEKQVDELKTILAEEKRGTRKISEQNEIYEKRSLQHQQEISDVRNRLKMFQRKQKESESLEYRLSTISAEFDLERQTMSTNMSKLSRQLDQLSEKLFEEQKKRETEEKKNRDQCQELNELRTNEKVQLYEYDKIQKTCHALREELNSQKHYYETNFHSKDEMEEFRKTLECKMRLDLHKRLQEINRFAEEHTFSLESFNDLRLSGNRAKNGYEETVTQLKNDLSQVKESLLKGDMAKGATTGMEAQAFKDMYEKERNRSTRLEEKLTETKDRINLERNRTNYLLTDGLSKVSKELFDESFGKRNYSSPRSKSINSHPLDTWSTPVSSRQALSNAQPLSLKRRDFLC